jgi:osmotically-inducible protein OsmY
MLAAGCAAPGGGPTMSEADAEIAARVAQRLAFDAGLRDQLYGIDVYGGEVTVRGTVSSEAERLRLIGVVRGTPGVTGVIDRLRIVR